MTHVFTLQAKGLDGLTGCSLRTIESTTCFATKELAEGRIEKFRATLVANSMLCEPIEIKIIPHEIIYDYPIN